MAAPLSNPPSRATELHKGNETMLNNVGVRCCNSSMGELGVVGSSNLGLSLIWSYPLCSDLLIFFHKAGF
jgi:hypothetical protein